ncbi:MAG: class I SAM-dependent methyltransferase [Planctomycetes bacterium]|nr:class I SAM-dependent methyltransferase [Planctomycetota bacterium]
MKGRLAAGQRILDAGCGRGRNLLFLESLGAEVWGLDQDPAAIEALADGRRQLAVAGVEATGLPGQHFDAVVCNAVLHFARDEAHFDAMVAELFRLLVPGGFFFARLASDIGIENAVTPLGDRRFRLPDRSTRFLVDRARIIAATARVGAQLVEPIKTVHVDGLRCMTNWCAVKAER